MNVVYATMLCVGLHGTPPCYFSNVMPNYETCKQVEDAYPDHRLRCVYRELPIWNFTRP